MKHKLRLIKEKKGAQKGEWECINCNQFFAFYIENTEDVEKYVNKYYNTHYHKFYIDEDT